MRAPAQPSPPAATSCSQLTVGAHRRVAPRVREALRFRAEVRLVEDKGVLVDRRDWS